MNNHACSYNNNNNNTMDTNMQRSEIEQFLHDVRDHFRASLETPEYENSSNLFHVTAAESTERLLLRCERLLEKWTTKSWLYSNNNVKKVTQQQQQTNQSNVITKSNSRYSQCAPEEFEDNASYLDMTAANGKSTSSSREYIALDGSVDSDKTFRCSTQLVDRCNENGKHDSSPQRKSNLDNKLTEDERDNETDDEPQIYDICNVSQLNEPEDSLKAITPDSELMQTIDCPYMDLPAGHMAIQHSSKYGQLQRIEKRLFFDQSKKCFCGILNDWLLVYADGPTSSHPTITLYLKGNGIEIEHYGEGKRRDICFQITTADPNKKFVFQANNEVDAKEWIHAIEAAIRGDATTICSRKLPTPPVLKKMTFVNGKEAGKTTENGNTDCIYEEPSPLYHIHEPTELLISKTQNELQHSAKLPELPEKINSSSAIARKFEYDIPKCPALPLKSQIGTNNPHESEEISLLNISLSNAVEQKSTTDRLDFQSKVKDVHSKLSSQLSVGQNSDRLKKANKKTYSGISTDADPAVTTKTSPSTKEQKKLKKSNTPAASPQKVSNSKNNNTINNVNGNVIQLNANAVSPTSEKSAKNWFLNRLNKTTSSVRNSSIVSPIKCKQSEKENLLNSLEMGDATDGRDDFSNGNGNDIGNCNSSISSNPTSPILKSNSAGVGKSKVNMIINQFEASGHLAIFSVESLAGSAVASLSSFCESDCNYEPIMTVAPPSHGFMKKV